jgi:ribosomal protein L29
LAQILFASRAALLSASLALRQQLTAPRLLAAMEEAGWVSPEEAQEWRARIAAVRTYLEDPDIWVDGPEG